MLRSDLALAVESRGCVDAEYRELMRRIEYLSDEIVLEKRLGIALLLLLLAVLVFTTSRARGSDDALWISALRARDRKNLSLRNLSTSEA
ncbi:hypothetical protein C8R45DRAFT_961353 [Mycena sanguinolenta]|nr:hypothetical protein C8R45DRAFT_961353 [Mycena sanguinolenta]